MEVCVVWRQPHVCRKHRDPRDFSTAAAASVEGRRLPSNQGTVGGNYAFNNIEFDYPKGKVLSIFAIVFISVIVAIFSLFL